MPDPADRPTRWRSWPVACCRSPTARTGWCCASWGSRTSSGGRSGSGAAGRPRPPPARRSTVPTSSMTKILIGRPATASMTSSTITMIIAVPRSGCSSTRTIGMPAMISSRKTSRHARPSPPGARQYDATARISASTANSDGWSCKGPRLNQRAGTLGAAPDREHAQQGEHDQPVEDRRQLFEPPVVDQGHHHHGDDAEHDEEALLLQEGLGVLALGQQRATGGRVDHDHTDDRHQQGGDEQDEVERGHVAAGGNVCSGESGHNADSGREYRP